MILGDFTLPIELLEAEFGIRIKGSFRNGLIERKTGLSKVYCPPVYVQVQRSFYEAPQPQTGLAQDI